MTAAAAMTVAAAGCAVSNPVNTGPFGGAGNGGQNCVPIDRPGGIVTEGLNEVSDSWRGTVAVISRINLVRPRGLRLVRAYAVRLGDVPAYGDMPGLPSASDDGFGYPAWKHHVNAAGARVPYVPHLAFQTDLLLVLKVSAPTSTDQGINVWYHVGTRQYHLRTQFGLELVARPAHCQPWAVPGTPAKGHLLAEMTIGEGTESRTRRSTAPAQPPQPRPPPHQTTPTAKPADRAEGTRVLHAPQPPDPANCARPARSGADQSRSQPLNLSGRTDILQVVAAG